MNKINNKSIVYGLGILAILTLGITAIPENASAQYTSSGGYYYSDSNSMSLNNNQTYYPNYYQTAYAQPQPVAPAPTPTIYSDNKDPNAVNSSPASKTVAKAKADTSNSLAANAIFGANGFMPTGLIQWILFAILILIVVILVRKVSGGEKAYHSAPLKHA